MVEQDDENTSTHTLNGLDEKQQEPGDQVDDGHSEDHDQDIDGLDTGADNLVLSEHTLSKRPWRTQITDFEAIISAKYRGSGTNDDPFVVQWLDHDPENPKSYGIWHKCAITALIAFTTLCISLASSAYSGAAESIIRDFHCSEETYIVGLSIMVLGFALGPLVWAPCKSSSPLRTQPFQGPVYALILMNFC